MVGGRRQAINIQINNMTDDDKSMEKIKQDKEMGVG